MGVEPRMDVSAPHHWFSQLGALNTAPTAMGPVALQRNKIKTPDGRGNRKAQRKKSIQMYNLDGPTYHLEVSHDLPPNG